MHRCFQRHSRMKDLICGKEFHKYKFHMYCLQRSPHKITRLECVCARHRAKHLAHTSVNSHCFIPILQRDKLRPKRSGNLHKVNSISWDSIPGSLACALASMLALPVGGGEKEVSRQGLSWTVVDRGWGRARLP